MSAPAPRLRRRVAVEVLLFVAGSALYLGLWPNRPPYVDMTLGVAGMGLIGLLAWRTNALIWGPALPDWRGRLKESSLAMAAATAPVLALFALAGWLLARQQGPEGGALAQRFFRPAFFGALAFYFVYAWLQQMLFQYYLLGRWRVLFPRAPFWRLALLNGALYGLMHLCAFPDPVLVLLTVGGGIVWTLTYYRWRCLLPLALSHALLGATYFYWVRDSDKLGELLTR